jgi:hypothetical protein
MKCLLKIQDKAGKITAEIHDLPTKKVSQMLRKAAAVLADRKGHVLLSAKPLPVK